MRGGTARTTIGKRLLVLMMALAVLVAACAGDDDSQASPDTTTGAGASACEGVDLSFIGFAGEEGQVELEDWRAERNMTLEVNDTADFPSMISAVQVGQSYDLMTFPYYQSERMIASGILLPLDTSRLTNWDNMVEGLREIEGIRDDSGQVFGAPTIWGDGPFIYSPDRVDTPPQSYLDLANPEWENRFTIIDDPAAPFHWIALANGFQDSPLLTPEQLEIVSEQAVGVVANAAAFATGFQDATDRLVAGDIDLHTPGWEAMLTWADEKGVTLDFQLFTETAGGWWDGLAIPTTADDVDCAYEYLDAILSQETNAQLATNLASGTVNATAIDTVTGVASLYDYSLVTTLTEQSETTFKSALPPEEPPTGYTSLQDWLDAWEQVKHDAN